MDPAKVWAQLDLMEIISRRACSLGALSFYQACRLEVAQVHFGSLASFREGRRSWWKCLSKPVGENMATRAKAFEARTSVGIRGSGWLKLKMMISIIILSFSHRKIIIFRIVFSSSSSSSFSSPAEKRTKPFGEFCLSRCCCCSHLAQPSEIKIAHSLNESHSRERQREAPNPPATRRRLPAASTSGAANQMSERAGAARRAGQRWLARAGEAH